MISFAKGIFPAPSSKGIPLRAYNQRKKAAKLRSDRDKMLAFADLLAEGYEPESAALMLGWRARIWRDHASANQEAVGAAGDMSRFAVTDRLDAALEKVRARQMEVRAIYLTEKDRAALDRAESARWKRKMYVFHYLGHDLRTGKKSVIYSTHGVGVAIPARLSPRVRLAA